MVLLFFLCKYNITNIIYVDISQCLILASYAHLITIMILNVYSFYFCCAQTEYVVGKSNSGPSRPSTIVPRTTVFFIERCYYKKYIN